jgi:histone demethylase JARID1
MALAKGSSEAGRLQRGKIHEDLKEALFLTAAASGSLLFQVIKNKKWADLGRLMGYTAIPGLSAQLNKSYTRVILPYEDFCARARSMPSAASSTSNAPSQRPSSLSLDTSQSVNSTKSEVNSPMSTTSSPLSEPPDEADTKESSNVIEKPRRTTRMGSTDGSATPKRPNSVTKPVVPPPVFHDKKESKGSREYSCEICQKSNYDTQMLLCDGCDCGYHMFCLDPPLDSIPQEEWFCYTCIAGTGGDFGFDDGEEHCLSSFQARDREFRRRWFASHPPPYVPGKEKSPTTSMIGNVAVSEEDLEREFWRLTKSDDEIVEVEYGADVHSTTHGSAMPTMELHPLDPYARDPWNLNNMPILQDSLLRFIKSDISGMTVPWTYVGMTFSTFCWHNEDHYTSSINFMHWGETKTWYGIPGDDAEKFEAAIKNEAPDLFESQPDLLFQLVTLMNPQRVAEAGVRVSKCNQRAGEFVITFPKAYHCGFNHGLNLNEAVNFALADWLPLGRECALRYAAHRKIPVFSHDELLITIAQQSHTIKTAKWLAAPFGEMFERERMVRTRARALEFSEILQETDLPEDQQQCSVCKVFCYLSQVTCQCFKAVVCIDHHNLLCDRQMSGKHKILRQRFSDAELTEMMEKVGGRAQVPDGWNTKFTKVLQESKVPSLRSLRALLAEGERISHPLPELVTLRKCVERANEWLEKANAFLTRKHVARKRPKRARGQSSARPSDEVFERPEHTLDELFDLLASVEGLGFDAPEIAALQSLAQQAKDVRSRATDLLQRSEQTSDRTAFLKECERLVLDASSVNVYIEELVTVDKVVQREQLLSEIGDLSNDTPLTPDEVRSLVQRARACDLPSDKMQVLLSKQKTGEEWEKRAKHILQQSSKSLDDLKAIVAMDLDAAIDPALSDRIAALHETAMQYESQAQAWLQAKRPDSRPTVAEVMKMVNRAEKEFSIYAVADLKASADIALELETRCESVLKLEYTETNDVFLHFERWSSYAEEHLRPFHLPIFLKLKVQVERHKEWLAELPWYCKRHGAPEIERVMEDVVQSTRKDDDSPPIDEYVTCICHKPVRPPPAGEPSDAVQCDHCFARFHGACAANGGSCLFCDHHHWDGTLHKDRSWHFCFLPPMLANAPEITKHYSQDWRDLELLVMRTDRLSAVVGQFLSFASQPGNQRPEFIPQVRHYMRKLYRIQFAVSPVREVSFGLDLASLHRVLASQPASTVTRKRRRPKFTFTPDLDDDWSDGTRCICRGRISAVQDRTKIRCTACNHHYHAVCVAFNMIRAPKPEQDAAQAEYTCPLCCLRKGRDYKYSDVRVIPPGEFAGVYETCIDTQEMLDSFSREVIYKKLAKPVLPTVYVELLRFVPGQPDSSHGQAPPRPAIASPSAAAAAQPSTSNRPRSSSRSSSSPFFDVRVAGATSPNSSAPTNRAVNSTNDDWPRWSTVATPNMPPQSRYLENARASPPSSAQAHGVKRKHTDADEPPIRPIHPRSPSSKRRAPPEEETTRPHPNGQNGQHPSPRMNNGSVTHVSPSLSHRAHQPLSPSLQKIVSPSNHPATLPRKDPHSPSRSRH